MSKFGPDMTMSGFSFRPVVAIPRRITDKLLLRH